MFLLHWRWAGRSEDGQQLLPGTIPLSLLHDRRLPRAPGGQRQRISAIPAAADQRHTHAEAPLRGNPARRPQSPLHGRRLSDPGPDALLPYASPAGRAPPAYCRPSHRAHPPPVHLHLQRGGPADDQHRCGKPLAVAAARRLRSRRPGRLPAARRQCRHLVRWPAAVDLLLAPRPGLISRRESRRTILTAAQILSLPGHFYLRSGDGGRSDGHPGHPFAAPARAGSPVRSRHRLQRPDHGSGRLDLSCPGLKGGHPAGALGARAGRTAPPFPVPGGRCRPAGAAHRAGRPAWRAL